MKKLLIAGLAMVAVCMLFTTGCGDKPPANVEEINKTTAPPGPPPAVKTARGVKAPTGLPGMPEEQK